MDGPLACVGRPSTAVCLLAQCGMRQKPFSRLRASDALWQSANGSANTRSGILGPIDAEANVILDEVGARDLGRLFLPAIWQLRFVGPWAVVVTDCHLSNPEILRQSHRCSTVPFEFD